MLKKIEQAVQTWVWKLVTPVIGAVLIGLLTIVLNQADNRVSAAEEIITKTTEKLQQHQHDSVKDLDTKLAKKVDNKHFDTVLKFILDKQETQEILMRDLNKTMRGIEKYIS